MINAPYEKEFVFHDGKHAKNVMELCEILDRLSESDFSIFVNSYKNDFANWLEVVLSEKGLAEKLRTTISKGQTLTFIRARLREMSLEQYSLNITGANVLKLSEPMTVQRLADSWHENPPSGVPKVENSKYEELKHMENLNEQDHMHHESAERNHEAEHKHLDPLSHDHHSDVRGQSNKWYDFFKSRDISKKSLTKNVIEEGDKHHAETQLKEQVKDNNSENIFWIVLYGLLIGLIIILLVYKLLFKG